MDACQLASKTTKIQVWFLITSYYSFATWSQTSQSIDFMASWKVLGSKIGVMILIKLKKEGCLSIIYAHSPKCQSAQCYQR